MGDEGGAAAELSAALEVAVSRLRRMRDPERRMACATELLDVLRRAELEVSHSRDAAVVRLHQRGHSLHDLGTRAGLTRGRIGQILQRARQA